MIWPPPVRDHDHSHLGFTIVFLTPTLAIVLFFYESFIMIGREVSYFWTVKPTGASLLFFANKAITTVFSILMLVMWNPSFSDKVGTVYVRSLLR